MLPESGSSVRLTGSDSESDPVAVIDMPMTEMREETLDKNEKNIRVERYSKRSSSTSIQSPIIMKDMSKVNGNNNRLILDANKLNGHVNHGLSKNSPSNKRKIIHPNLNFPSPLLASPRPGSPGSPLSSPPSGLIDKIYHSTRLFVKDYFKCVLFILYNIYLVVAIKRTWHKVS